MRHLGLASCRTPGWIRLRTGLTTNKYLFSVLRFTTLDLFRKAMDNFTIFLNLTTFLGGEHQQSRDHFDFDWAVVH